MLSTVHIDHLDAASDDDARDALARLFTAGDWMVKARHEDGPGRVISFSADPALGGDPAALLRACFPTPGDYLVQPVIRKAAPASEAEGAHFAEWWLERLATEAEGHFADVRSLVLAAVERFLNVHSGRLATPAARQELEALLFDLRQGIRWSLAAPISPEIRARLQMLGFIERDVLDFPGIAYRMGLLEQRFAAHEPTSWEEVLRVVAEAPLLPSDQAAIAVAQESAGRYLTPVLLRDGQTLAGAAAQRERDLLRVMTADAIRGEVHPHAFARSLYKQFDPEGITRDWDRVARTEMQTARLLGSYRAQSDREGWTGETQLYRSTAAVPCTACLRLFKNPDGTPRIYTVAELEAADALGVNRGPSKEWHITKGPTHPNCLCPSWQRYVPALDRLFRDQAERKWAAVMRERGLAEAA